MFELKALILKTNRHTNEHLQGLILFTPPFSYIRSFIIMAIAARASLCTGVAHWKLPR